MARLISKADASINSRILKATILEVDKDTDTATVQDVEGNIWQNVPIFYHCRPDALQRENGAIEGASNAFSIGDEVWIKLEPNKWMEEKPVIFARVDGLKRCGYDFVCLYDDKWYGISIGERLRLEPIGRYDIPVYEIPDWHVCDDLKFIQLYAAISCYNRIGKKMILYGGKEKEESDPEPGYFLYIEGMPHIIRFKPDDSTIPEYSVFYVIEEDDGALIRLYSTYVDKNYIRRFIESVYVYKYENKVYYLSSRQYYDEFNVPDWLKNYYESRLHTTINIADNKLCTVSLEWAQQSEGQAEPCCCGIHVSCPQGYNNRIISITKTGGNYEIVRIWQELKTEQASITCNNDNRLISVTVNENYNYEGSMLNSYWQWWSLDFLYSDACIEVVELNHTMQNNYFIAPSSSFPSQQCFESISLMSEFSNICLCSEESEHIVLHLVHPLFERRIVREYFRHYRRFYPYEEPAFPDTLPCPLNCPEFDEKQDLCFPFAYRISIAKGKDGKYLKHDCGELNNVALNLQYSEDMENWLDISEMFINEIETITGNPFELNKLIGFYTG